MVKPKPRRSHELFGSESLPTVEILLYCEGKERQSAYKTDEDFQLRGYSLEDLGFPGKYPRRSQREQLSSL
jgi:hypothetical protein